MRQHALSLLHEPPARLGDAIPRSNSPTGEQAPIAQQVLTHGVEAAVLLLKRGDEVLQEEVGAGMEGHGVGDAGLEDVGVGLDGVERLEDGGGGDGVEEVNEGFDGRDGLGEVGVGGEEISVGGNDTVEELEII